MVFGRRHEDYVGFLLWLGQGSQTPLHSHMHLWRTGMPEAVPVYPPLGCSFQCQQHPRQTFVALRVASIIFLFYLIFAIVVFAVSESEGSIKGWLFFFSCNVWGRAGWQRVYLNVGCKHTRCRYRGTVCLQLTGRVCWLCNHVWFASLRVSVTST